MYNTLYNINIQHFIKIRLHIGNQENKLDLKNTSYLYGYRHNISIYSIEKI